jgi:hypothetical protein
MASHGLEPLRTLGASPQVRAAMADDRRAAKDWTFPTVCGRYERHGVLEFCQIGDPSARQVLLIGDSHAQELAPRYVHAFDGRRGAGLTLMTIPGCIPIPGVSGYGARNCGRTWREAYHYAEGAGFARVVIVAAWPAYFLPSDTRPLGVAWIDGDPNESSDAPHTLGAVADAAYARLASAVRGLQARGVQVVLMSATPSAASGDPHALYSRAFWTGSLDVPPQSRAVLEARNADDRRRLTEVIRATGAILVDSLDGLCDADKCPVLSDGRTLFKDEGHFRGSMMTSTRFAFLDAWLSPRIDPKPISSPVHSESSVSQ